MDQPKVSIILINWNGQADTIDCLNSIGKLDYSNYEIVVVDNASTDNLVATVKKDFPHVNLIESEKNLGFTGGNNLAMKLAVDNGADYCWLLNNDTTVAVDSLAELVKVAEQSPTAGLLSSIIYYQDWPEKILYCGSYIDIEKGVKKFTREIAEIQRWQNEEPEKVCVWGTAMLVKRQLINDIGYLDDQFFAYEEDSDYSLRAIDAGYFNQNVWSSAVYHKKERYQPDKVQYPVHYYYYFTRNDYIFWMKYLPRKKRFAFRLQYWATVIKRAASCRDGQNMAAASATLAGGWGAIRGERGIWQQDIKMPKRLSSLLLSRPYLWANLLSGHWDRIFAEGLNRLKSTF